MGKVNYKQWFVIHRDGHMLDIVFGDKEAVQALSVYPGARRRGYWTYRAAVRAVQNGLDSDDSDRGALF